MRELPQTLFDVYTLALARGGAKTISPTVC